MEMGERVYVQDIHGNIVETETTDVREELERENKNLKEISEKTRQDYMQLAVAYRDLEEENKKLKSDLAFERTMLDNVSAEYKSLQNVIKKLEEELAHYKNTEAIQKSNAASRYKYPSTSYVDRELNVIN